MKMCEVIKLGEWEHISNLSINQLIDIYGGGQNNWNNEKSVIEKHFLS